MPDRCPSCKHTWLGEEIPDGLMAANPGHYDRETAEEDAEMYGWTPENRKCFNKHVIGIETPSYDGISYWLCLKCQTFFDRFTMAPSRPDLSEADWAGIHQWLGEEN